MLVVALFLILLLATFFYDYSRYFGKHSHNSSWVAFSVLDNSIHFKINLFVQKKNRNMAVDSF